jgi:hypothetical protein
LLLIGGVSERFGPGENISMGRRPLAFTVEKPIPAALVTPSSANVVAFNNRGRLLAKLEPITSTHSSKKVRPPPSAATEGGTSGSYEPKGVIIDFAHADRGGAKGHKCRSNASETGLSIADYAAIACIVMSIAFYPVLACLFWS